MLEEKGGVIRRITQALLSFTLKVA